MSMATGVVLFVIGAILAFAVHVDSTFVSLPTVGAILMAGGAVVFVIGLIFAIRGRRSVTSTSADAGGSTTVRRTSDDAGV